MRASILFGLCATCGGPPDLVANEGFSIDCGRGACDWVIVEGTGVFGPSWHDGDAGLDLSVPGRVVVEQRSAPFTLSSRELILTAAVAAPDGGARFRFEIDWYVAGAGAGVMYWERGPVLLATRGFDVTPRGAQAIKMLVAVPSLEVSGLVLRIIKDGDGRAVVDEVSLREPEVAP
jgi:hypothetical protein